jgi:hypothetical protein
MRAARSVCGEGQEDRGHDAGGQFPEFFYVSHANTSALSFCLNSAFNSENNGFCPLLKKIDPTVPLCRQTPVFFFPGVHHPRAAVKSPEKVG